MPRLCIVLWDRQCLLYLWKMFKNLRNELGSWTRTTTTSYQCQAMSSKRTPFAVPNMDLLSGNQCTCKAQEIVAKKACQPKHGEYKSIHERWHKDDQYRNSLSLIGWTEEQIIEHDKIALEDPFIRRNKTWKNSKYKTLGTQVEPRRCSTTTKSTTWFYSNKTRMKKECTTNMWKSVNKNIDQFLVINNHDNEEDKHSKESTSTTIESILEPAGGSIIQNHRETCRIRPRQQIGTVTIGRREVGSLGILRGLTIRDFFLRSGPISVAGRKNNRREVWTEHSHSMYRCAQCVSTSHCTVWSLSITRTCVAQVQGFVCRKHSVIHASCLVPCRTWRWPPAQVLSHLPSPILQSSSSTHPSRLSHDPWIHSDDSRRSCGSSDLPQVVSQKESSSTGILRLNINIKHETELWKMTIRVQSLKIWMNLEKLVSGRCPTTSHWYTQLTSQQKVLLTRTWLGWLHRCIIQEWEGDFEFFSKTQSFRETLVQWLFTREKQVHNGHKLITEDERAWCQVHLESPEFQGNLMQCFHLTVNQL